MNDRNPAPEASTRSQSEDELELLALRQQIQSARLELESHKQAARNLVAELDALRARQDERAKESAGDQLERVFVDAASPAAQLLVQAALLEQGRPVQARDVLATARRLLRALQKHGLAVEGEPGSQTRFDPDRHAPLSAETALERGQEVVVRIPGISLGGKVLARAAVEASEELP